MRPVELRNVGDSSIRLRRSGHRASLGVGLAILALAAAFLSSGCCKLVPWALAVDPSLIGNSDGNGMLEPGETVAVAPSWSKRYDGQPPGHPGDFGCSGTDTETGAATSLTGPIQADYVIGDDAAAYDAFGSLTSPNVRTSITRKCSDCYALSVSAPTGRPASHWDATFTEALTGTLGRTKNWTLHIGDSFTDVPRSSPFYKKIETLLHHGITSGCSPTEFCPGQEMSRAASSRSFSPRESPSRPRMSRRAAPSATSPTTARREASPSLPTSHPPTRSAGTSTTSPRRTWTRDAMPVCIARTTT